jgi:hypothetical protein
MSNASNNNLRAVVLPTNAEAIIVWLWDGVIPDCLGFSVRRINTKTGEKTPLNSRLVKFKGQAKSANTTLDTHPIQGNKWSDGKIVVGETYQWEIVPMLGKPGSLKEGTGVLTKEVTIGFDYGPYIQACFNRGHLVSTQALAEMIGTNAEGKPDDVAFLAAINDPSSKIAQWLGAALPDFCRKPYEEAKAIGGHVWNLFYELSYPQFVEYLVNNKEFWSMVLANAGKGDETNAPSAKILEEAGCAIVRRIIKEGTGLGHNKVGVVTDKEGVPVSTLFQSCNVTATGFYAQSNHALRIEDKGVAALVKDYYDRTLADCSASPIQSDEYRAANMKVADPVILGDGTSVQVIFCPCSMDRVKPRVPDDGKVFPLLDMVPTMKVAKDVIMGAQQGVYGVAFYPGTPSIIDVISYLACKKPSMPVRFTVSSDQAMPRGPKKKTPKPTQIVDTGEGHPESQAPSEDIVVSDAARKTAQQVAVFQQGKKFPAIISASALEDGLNDWVKEMLKLPNAHAVTHAKFVAVDPWGANPVLLGAASDNMGMRAAINNDEIFLVIRNNPALVQAYASFAMAINSHFLWRYLVKTGQSTFSGELADDTSWQDRFLKGKTRKEYEAMIATQA